MNKIKATVLLTGLIVLGASGMAFAWSKQQMATPIVGYDCRGPYKAESSYDDGSPRTYVTDSNGNKVKDDNPNNHYGDCSGTVYRFNDNGNTCYIAKGTNSGGLYCVK